MGTAYWPRVAAALVAILAAASVVESQQAGPPPDGKPPVMQERGERRPGPQRAPAEPGMEWLIPGPVEIPRLGEALGLTEEQKAAIQKLAQRKAEQGRPLIEQLPALYRQVSEIMLGGSPDPAEAKRLVAEIRGIQERVAGFGIDFWVAVRAQLTPQQNARLSDLLRERLRRGWNRRPAGPLNPPPGGPGEPKPPPGGPGAPPPEPDPESGR